MEAEYGHNLKTSFELKHAILGKDTVTFIGEIQKLHDPLPEIQFLLKEGWEHASQEAGVKSKSECKIENICQRFSLSLTVDHAENFSVAFL